MGRKARVNFEPRPPGDPLRTRADASRLAADLGYTTTVAIAEGLAAEAASTGEQKAVLIAIVLGQARLQRSVRGEPPLLLLDEVAAHLDGARRTALFDTLAGLDGQAWITGTDPALFAPLTGAARFLSIADGTLSATIS